MVLSTIAVALSVAIFATFIESQPERWLQRAWSGGNNGHKVGYVPAYPWEFQDGDDSLPDRHVGVDDGPLDRLDICLDNGEL
jgi:hypothetical protein